MTITLKTLLRRRWRGRIRRRFAFPSSVQHLQIVLGRRFQIPGLQCLAGAVDVFDREIEAAFALAEAAPVVGQAGNGGFLGAAAGFQDAHLGFEFGQEIAASADWRAIRSCRRLEVLANHPRVTSRDSQETDGRTFWLSSSLFPVS